MGLSYWAGVKRTMVPLCFGQRDTWPLEHPVGMVGIPCQSGRERLVVALEELGMFGIVIEGCILVVCHRAGYRVTAECMQGAGPKAPGIGSVAEEWMEGQMAGPSLHTGYWIFSSEIRKSVV